LKELLTSLATFQVNFAYYKGNRHGKLTAEGYSENGIVFGPSDFILREELQEQAGLGDKIYGTAVHN
jgi:hypothetical protein